MHGRTRSRHHPRRRLIEQTHTVCYRARDGQCDGKQRTQCFMVKEGAMKSCSPLVLVAAAVAFVAWQGRDAIEKTLCD